MLQKEADDTLPPFFTLSTHPMIKHATNMQEQAHLNPSHFTVEQQQERMEITHRAQVTLTRGMICGWRSTHCRVERLNV